MKIVRSVMMFLLPLLAGGFYWEDRLPFTANEHLAAQILIVAAVCLLSLACVRIGEGRRLRNDRQTAHATYHSCSDEQVGVWNLQLQHRPPATGSKPGRTQ